MTRPAPGVAVALLLLLAACAASSRWQHPTLPREQWAVDEAACRAAANAEVNKNYDRDFNWTGADTGGVAASHDVRMSRYQATRQRDSLTAACLEAKGYSRAPR